MMDIEKPNVDDLLSAFDDATYSVEYHERAMKHWATKRAQLVRDMLRLVTIEELSRITGLRIIRLKQLREKR